MKKVAEKKLTVEQKLREEIKDLKKELGDTQEQLGETKRESKNWEAGIATLHKILTHAYKGPKGKNGIEIMSYGFERHDFYGRDTEKPKPGTRDFMEESIATAIFLAMDYAREDEGTLLMQEHIDDLMTIVRATVNDDKRVNDGAESLLELKHKIVQHMNPDQRKDFGNI